MVVAARKKNSAKKEADRNYSGWSKSINSSKKEEGRKSVSSLSQYFYNYRQETEKKERKRQEVKKTLFQDCHRFHGNGESNRGRGKREKDKTSKRKNKMGGV